MYGSAAYAPYAGSRDRTRTLFGQTMGLVALTAAVFAGLTMVDFQRLRRSRGLDSAPLIAASIFLDALNVFLFFLRIFGGGGRD